MVSPQIENGYIKISNELFDALIAYRLSGEQRQVLDVIFRKTYGFNKKTDHIALSQFIEMTGINKQNVVRAINNLLSKKIITVIKFDNKKGHIYEIVKDFTKWVPLSKKITVIKKDNKPLSILSTTKDNTKDNTLIVKTPYHKIVDLYHEILSELPRVVKLSDTRKRQLKARWFESDKTQSLGWWEEFFGMIAGIRFLNGDNNRNWKADLQWITKEENFIKILEGKYK